MWEVECQKPQWSVATDQRAMTETGKVWVP